MPRLVDILQKTGGILFWRYLVGNMNDAILTTLQNIQMDAKGFVLMRANFINSILQEIADNLIGFINAGNYI